MKTDFGIYIHIPFCSSKCSYCNFYSRVSSPQIREDYVSALCRETEKYKGRLSPKTVYIGGGTPSLLTPEELLKIHKSLGIAFDLSKVEEFTVETNPESTTEEFLSAFTDCGGNRVSIGVQSFDDGELSLCGRKHTSAEAEKAIEKIRKSGIDNISADFIMGLPSQTEKSLLSSLGKAAGLEIPHISAYILKVEENTVFSKKGIKEPDEDRAAEMYLAASDFLSERGYEHYEISNFAKNGKKALHNSSYWQGKNYIAFGAGAYGFEDNVRYHISPDINAFISGNAEKITDEILSDGNLAEEYFLLSLRTSDGILKAKMNPEMLDFANKLEKTELGKFKKDSFALTPKGFLVSNEIISDFIDML